MCQWRFIKRMNSATIAVIHLVIFELLVDYIIISINIFNIMIIINCIILKIYYEICIEERIYIWFDIFSENLPPLKSH